MCSWSAIYSTSIKARLITNQVIRIRREVIYPCFYQTSNIIKAKVYEYINSYNNFDNIAYRPGLKIRQILGMDVFI